MASYEAFIESYLKDKQKNNRALSYGEWVTAHIGPAQTKQNEALTAAQTAYGASLPSYGQAGEQLGRAGLSGSGYSHRRAAQNYADFLGVKDDFAESFGASFESDYQKYLSQYEKKQESTQKEVFSHLKSGKYTNVSKAYAHSLSMGLNEENAQKVARQAVSYNEVAAVERRQNLRRTVFKTMIIEQMLSKSGYVYAIQCGLSDVEARTLAEAAEKIYFAIKTGDRNLSFDDIYQQVENKVHSIYKNPMYLYEL